MHMTTSIETQIHVAQMAVCAIFNGSVAIRMFSRDYCVRGRRMYIGVVIHREWSYTRDIALTMGVLPRISVMTSICGPAFVETEGNSSPLRTAL